jgi:hypothetical protein
MEEVVSAAADCATAERLISCAGNESSRLVSAALSFDFPNMLVSYSCTHWWKLIA